jgi:hypothetical protein
MLPKIYTKNGTNEIILLTIGNVEFPVEKGDDTPGLYRQKDFRRFFGSCG